VPLQSGYAPNVKLLSRKPGRTAVARKDPITGIERLTVEDDDEDEDQIKVPVLTAEERKVKAQKEREEKQRKYEEVRLRLFGTSSGGASGTPGDVTPPSMPDSANRRGRGGGQAGAGGGGGAGNGRGAITSPRPGSARQLYDPSNPVRVDRSNNGSRAVSPGKASGKGEDAIIREPRGPDGSGQGGRGFARRGGSPFDLLT